MSFIQIGFILIVACIVSILSRWQGLPYSVGLVASGIILALIKLPMDLVLTHDLLFNILLPPLIFEAAMQLNWSAFRNNLPVTLTLAFLGVFLAGIVVVLGMHIIVDWSWFDAILFGTLIVATDPISVIATFKEMKVESRLRLLVESESLLNDGVVAVVFAVLISMSRDGTGFNFDEITLSFLKMIFGGVITGGLITIGVLLLSRYAKDQFVEITLTIIAAYGSFLTAEYFHMSGIIASLTAGLIVGNADYSEFISKTGRDYIAPFWEYIVFLVNSTVFLLIGLHEADRMAQLLSITVIIAVILVFIGRSVTVYSICALFSGSSLKIDIRHQHILVWGGLRGALPLALALIIPDSFSEKQNIITATFAVVAFSIFVQGLTMSQLIKILRLKPDSE
ncbi:MAG: cation:proton antiporter [Rhodospirillaceae bacterium]|jgi:CPA1 family monovalent cation:H+ antiporter|nr:cation:proton antiporter [Rhodospirillaceae bacterium]